MKNRVILAAILCLAMGQAASGDVLDIPVLLDKTIQNNGAVSDNTSGTGEAISYEWAENNRWKALFGFDITPYLSLANIQAVNSLSFHVHNTYSYYTGNNVHLYSSLDDSWSTGTYAYGNHGGSLGSNYVPSQSTGPYPNVNRWYQWNISGVSGDLTDNGLLGLYLHLPTKDDWHNYSLHKFADGDAFLRIDYDYVPDGGATLVLLVGGLLSLRTARRRRHG